MGRFQVAMQKRDVVLGIVFGTLVLVGLFAVGYFVYRRTKERRRKRGVLADAEDTDDFTGCGSR